LTGQRNTNSLYLVNSGSTAQSLEGALEGDAVGGGADQFNDIFQSNAGYVEDMYARYNQSPSLVTPEWRAYFAGFKGGFAACMETIVSTGVAATGYPRASTGAGESQTQSAAGSPGLNTEVAVYQVTRAYQEYGHLKAKIDPLSETSPKTPPMLVPANYGLNSSDYAAMTAVGIHFGWAPMTVGEYLNQLDALYCGPVGIETEHVVSEKERAWLESRMSRILTKPDAKTRAAMCTELGRADAFEKTIATKYLGQKRFSIEGADAQIAALESLIDHAATLGVREFCMAMAHRGRLNVLINVAQKPMKKLFAEFDGRKSPDSFGDGDVKYHCGWETDRKTRNGASVRVSLAFNPSHLEFVDAVVMGESRAIQDERHGGDRSKVMPILMHGDAAFAGQGVVYESMQMVTIPGHQVGGCIHLIANNQVGFTTNPSDSRSSLYCSDIGKAFGAPIFHVNAEALDELHQVMCLAAEYRQTFGRDVIIDLVCFRRHGHNEADEPGFTQPAMYRIIKNKPAPFEAYLKKLTQEDPATFSETTLMNAYQDLRTEMTAIFDDSQKDPEMIDVFPPSRRRAGYIHAGVDSILTAVSTGVDKETLVKLGERALEVPAGFAPNAKLERIVLGERKEMLAEQKPADWGMGEFLCYASLLNEGHSVRICGQDAGRGTFSHRHAVLVDSNTEARWLGLSQVAQKNAKIEIIDSLLSETAAMGYEYGYATRNLDTLTIWEGQFGDFANGAQVIVDQFLVSGESKWGQMQGLVLFLPHGYEGQGPEHSSGRLERFMQLAAEANMQICCLTKSSQLFHVLRRQVKRDFRKPLIIMTPKSFLRSAKAAVNLDKFTTGGFEEVLADERELNPNIVERIVLCSGKVALDAFAHAESADNAQRIGAGKTAIIRLEQVYPLHVEKLKAAVAAYPKAKQIFWAQEEPQNMGAYFTLQEELSEVARGLKFKNGIRYIGRSKRASPAVGSPKVHAKEFAALMDAIFLAEDTKTV
jgi:2-oxoglutarate dehydrogenase E1 component